MFEHRCAVRWGDVDAAGIVYFPQFFDYAHQALEALFAALPGGYADLTQRRKIGVPTVHLEADYRAPLRYGDAVLVALTVERLGATSAHLRYELRRAEDLATVATVKQVVVVTNLATLRPMPPPDDVRAVLLAHLDGAPPGA